jgi:hypothetical protein
MSLLTRETSSEARHYGELSIVPCPIVKSATSTSAASGSLVPMSMRCDTTMVWVDQGSHLDGGNTGGAIRLGDTVGRKQVRGHPRWTHSWIICTTPGSIGRPTRSAWTSSIVRSYPSFRARRSAVDAMAGLGSLGRRGDPGRYLVTVLHAAVASFQPPADAVWREGGRWEPALIIGHNDAALLKR